MQANAETEKIIELGKNLSEKFGLKIGTATFFAQRLLEIGIQSSNFELTVPALFGRVIGYSTPWYGVRALPKELRDQIKTVISSGRAMYVVPAPLAASIFQFFLDNRPFKRGKHKKGKGG